MKKMYFLKDRKEAVIDRLTYMSKHRQEYLQDKEHGMITLQFKQGMPVIRFSSGRVTSYWDFSFDGKKMTVQRMIWTQFDRILALDMDFERGDKP